MGSTLEAAHAQGQLFKDSALQALYQAERLEELLRERPSKRLASEPDDAQAVLAVAMASLSRDDAAARKQALQLAEACVAKAAPGRALPLRLGRGAGRAGPQRGHVQGGTQRRHRAHGPEHGA